MNMKIIFFLFTAACFSQTIVSTNITILPDTQISVSNNFIITSGSRVLNDGELILKGNIINNGVLSYTPSLTTGNLRFEGLNQDVFSENPIILNNVLFNNNSTLLNGTLQINNDANFSSGIVNTKDFGGTVFFNELSDHLNTSHMSFVNGQVLRSGFLDFVFPTGDADFYRPMTILNLTSLNSFSSTYFSENSNAQFPHENKTEIINFIDNEEYWELRRTDGLDFAVIELVRDEASSSLEIMNADLNALRIVRWDADRNFWLDESGVVNTDNNAIRTISNVTDYGIYALAITNEEIVSSGDLLAYNNLTPNGDGINDTFIITGIENYPDNNVKIVNRWGSVVYEVDGYNNTDRAFSGVANSGLSMSDGMLPSGTYYYVLNYTTADNQVVKKVQYLYLNGK